MRLGIDSMPTNSFSRELFIQHLTDPPRRSRTLPIVRKRPEYFSASTIVSYSLGSIGTNVLFE